MSIWSDAVGIFSAIASQDSFEMKDAFRTDAAWYIGAVVLVIGGYLVMLFYRAVPFVEKYLEKTVMVVSYLAIAGIIFWGVVDRFVFSSQVPWSTTIPPFLFMIMAWFGASYNVRVRTHLSFSEFRTMLPRKGQFISLMCDAALWFVFALVVFVTTLRLTTNSAANFQIVLGTDNVMQWWFLMSAPIAFVLMVGRIFQNLTDTLKDYRSGEPLIKQAVIGGDA